MEFFDIWLIFYNFLKSQIAENQKKWKMGGNVDFMVWSLLKCHIMNLGTHFGWFARKVTTGIARSKVWPRGWKMAKIGKIREKCGAWLKWIGTNMESIWDSSEGI